jgi:hypothetical protein
MCWCFGRAGHFGKDCPQESNEEGDWCMRNKWELARKDNQFLGNTQELARRRPVLRKHSGSSGKRRPPVSPSLPPHFMLNV